LGNLRVACRCAEQIETAQTNRNADRPEIGYAPTVVQMAHYDPWGVKLPLFLSNGFDKYKGSPEDRFKYNGKEQQPDIGYYDYGARMYDPTTGRWFGIDPLALLSCNVSPYTFVKNDPINYIDIGGEFRFPKQIREDFPLSVELLERILNDLSWAPAIINSLAKYTGLSQSAVKKDFMTDFGPEIDYLNTDTYGFYTPTHEHFTLGGGKENKPQSSGSSRFASLTDQKNEITLILNELETSIKHYKKSPNVDNKNDMKQKTLMVVISALHEYCHYGIYKTGNRKKIEQIDKGDDEGTGWERLYLGKRVESDRASITNTQTTPKKIWENGSNNSTVAIELLWFISRANNESQKEKKTEKRQTRNPGDDE
jgi:RHS repeat-associated protein